MTLWKLVLTILAVCYPVSSFGQLTNAPQPWCASDSDKEILYDDIPDRVRGMLGFLSWYTTEYEGSERSNQTKSKLPALTQEAVFGLANVYSLASRHTQSCDFTSDFYHGELFLNLKFFAFMNRAFDSLEKPLGPEVIAALNDLKSSDKISANRPVWTATAAILGENVEWDHRTGKPSALFQANPENELFNKTLDEGYELLDNSRWSDKLRMLSTFYIIQD